MCIDNMYMEEACYLLGGFVKAAIIKLVRLLVIPIAVPSQNTSVRILINRKG